MRENYPSNEPDKAVSWFVPRETPQGDAPEAIREQWVGVPLPVGKPSFGTQPQVAGRYILGANVLSPNRRIFNDPSKVVLIGTVDAFVALREAGREEAANWWEAWFSLRNSAFGEHLIFDAEQGELYSTEQIEEIRDLDNRLELIAKNEETPYELV